MRHALVTAGSKGLGKKVTEIMLNKGYSVTVTYFHDQRAAENLYSEFASFAKQIQIIQADVTKKEDIVRVINDIKARFGRLDALINNAGPYIFERKKLADYEDDEWYEMIEGNLSAVFHLFKLSIPIMRKQGFGRIINYGFQGAQSAPGWLYRSAFSAAKVGLVSLTKTIAIEEAEYGITANMICPGKITGFMKEASIVESRQMRDEETPVKRSGTGEDIARMIAYLCEEDSDMITGAIIDITGGIDVVHQFR